MTIEERVGPDKPAARRLIEPLLARAGVKHRELAEALYLSRGALARKLGVRYPDRFTEHELRTLAAFLDLTEQQRDSLWRCYGYGPPGEPPAAATTHPPPNDGARLPAALTSFIGRQWERATVRRLLATTRLLTLTGAGGIGKTRLAIEVAREAAPLYRDGVCLVELSAAGDGADVLPAVAAALGVRDAPGQPLAAVVRDALRPRELLLVLDNCEHVLDAGASLAEALLAGCPGLTLLATSREPLGAAGEMLWRVPSLSVPPDPADQPETVVSESESVRLFSDRAAAVLPVFAVTDANAGAVARICRRLDGIPLAIELAAARMLDLAPEAIAERLDRALWLLTGGRRSALPRHGTLRAAIDWSHDLLSERERVLFRRLAVFAGGFDLAAVEAVVAEPDDAGMGDRLARLVRGSVVMMEPRREPARFRLLEPLRQFAGERLAEAGEADALQRRHLQHYAALLETAHAALRGPEQARWLERLDAEHDNLRAALAWSLEHGAVEAGVQMLGRLALYWEMHGRFTEGLIWAERVLSAASEASSLLHARALHSAGHLARLAGDFAGSIAYSERSLALFLELGDEHRAASVLVNIAGAYWNQGDFAAARRAYEETLAVFRRLDDVLLIAQTLANLGMVANAQADFDAARTVLDESLVRFRALGDRWSEARVLLALAAAADLAGDHIAARPFAEESLTLYRALGDERGEAWVLGRLASIAVHRHDDTVAYDLYEQSLRLARRLADKRHLVQALHGLAGVAVRRGEVGRAIALERESLALCRDIGASWGIAESLEGLAGAALAGRRPAVAARLFAVAEGLRKDLAYPRPPADCAAHEGLIAAVRSALGGPAFAAAWAEGRMLAPEAAIGEAIAAD